VGAEVVLADEPTGALDRENSRSVAALLRGLAAQGGVCVVIATHDQNVAAVMDRCILLENGRAVASEATV
jgi:ABC-type lipoprotein export system ATPase subunit